MEKSCVLKKFKSIFVVSTFAMMIEYIVLLSDNIIIGHFIGEEALSAVSLVMPIFSIIIFFTYIISAGTTMLMSYNVGAGERSKANKLFSQGIILAVVVGIILTGVLVVLKKEFLELLSISEQLYDYSSGYYTGLMFMPLFQMLNGLFYSAIIAEGGETVCTISSVIQVLSNIGLSIMLSFKVGIVGVSVASVISNVLALLVLLVFLLLKKTQLRFQWYLNGKQILKMIKYSSNDSLIYLYLFIMQSCLNLYLVRRFPEESLIIFSVVINVISLIITGFDGIGEALQPLVCIYHSENNSRGIRKLMNTAARTALIEGGVVTILLLIFANQIPGILGITDSQNVEMTAMALRIYAVAVIFVSFSALLSSYYLYTGKLKFSLTIMAVLYLLPIPMAMLLGEWFGLNGVWAGIAISAVLTLLMFNLYVRKRYREQVGTGYLPLFISSAEEEKQLSYDIHGTTDQVMELVYQIETELKNRGVDRGVRNRIELIIEEAGMLMIDKNKGTTFLIECTLILDQPIVIILRDNGAYNDVADGDTTDLTSFQTYASVMLLTAQRNRNFILTGGLNRHVFKI